MIKFSKEKVLLMHQLIAEETGGSIGVRDEGLLESALESILTSPFKASSPICPMRSAPMALGVRMPKR